MKKVQAEFDTDFEVLAGNDRSQCAVMVLESGESTGGPDNEHEGSDQWLVVISGDGRAIVSGREVPLKQGTVLLIEKGEPHEIRNNSSEPLQTINFYVPPAY